MVTTKKNLLSKFELEDQINIMGLATTEKPPVIVIKKTEHFRYFSLLAMIYGCLLLTANVASSKLIVLLGVTWTGGTLPYMLSYVLSDIITEVYGYKRIRQLIWGTILSSFVMLLFIILAINFPPSPFWNHQEQYALVLNSLPKIFIASIVSYFFGEFINSYIIARLKLFHNRGKLWFRIICASIIAITVDNFLFLTISYWGTLPFNEIVKFSSSSYLLSLIFEWSCIPFIIFFSNKLKTIENVDILDIDTNFNPFSLDVDYTN